MTNTRKLLQYIVTIAVLIVIGFTIWSQFPGLFRFLSGQGDEVVTSVDLEGKSAPVFTALDTAGVKHSLQQYRGKPIILNMWASWCGPCRDEMPLIKEAYNQYRDEGLVVLGQNVGENLQTVKGFKDEFKLEFPILLDNNNLIADLYMIDPIPTTFFIDRNGIVQTCYIGELDESSLKKNLKQIMDEPLKTTENGQGAK